MSDRVEQLRASLREQGLDAAMVSLPANRFYLSGFSAEDDGVDESAGILVVDKQTATLFTGSTNALWAEIEARSGIEVVAWERPWESFIGKRLGERGYGQIGFEDTALSVASFHGLSAAAGDTMRFQSLGGSVNTIRSIKDADELRLMEAAIRLTDEVFVTVAARLRVGASEREIAWWIEREMRERGAEGAAFPTIVASGPHSARPHHNPTDRQIAYGEPIIIDMGARLGGYAADLTRTVWVGEPTARLRAVYNVVQSAHDAALAALRAGTTGKEIDAVARDLFAEADYGEAFSHGLGHGLGIRVHEAPSLGKMSNDVLAAGQVVTIEPGAYFPEWGGVRIEDVAVVEAAGCRVITSAPKVHPGLPHETATRRGGKATHD